MKRNWIELESDLWVPFDYKDPIPGGNNLGRAEFVVCLRHWGRGDFEFWVDPVQTHIKEAWHYLRHEYYDFSIHAYEKLKDPNIWCFFWCEEHQASSFRVYSPAYAKYLRISYEGLSFHKERWDG